MCTTRQPTTTSPAARWTRPPNPRRSERLRPSLRPKVGAEKLSVWKKKHTVVAIFFFSCDDWVVVQKLEVRADEQIRLSIDSVHRDLWSIYFPACVPGNPCQQEQTGVFSDTFICIYLCWAVFSQWAPLESNIKTKSTSHDSLTPPAVPSGELHVSTGHLRLAPRGGVVTVGKTGLNSWKFSIMNNIFSAQAWFQLARFTPHRKERVESSQVDQ